MSGKDESVTSKNSLMGTKSGKKIIKQAMFKSKGYKQFNQYKEEYETNFPEFARRFANDLLQQIKADSSPNTTQQKFGEEVGSTEIILDSSQIDPIKTKLEKIEGVRSIDLWVKKSSNEYTTFSIESDISVDIRAEVSKTIVENKWGLMRLESMGMSLEDIFLKITTSE